MTDLAAIWGADGWHDGPAARVALDNRGRLVTQPVPPAMDTEDVIVCERCGRTTTDPDLWDPEAGTGRVFCDPCWPRRNDRD